MDPLKYPVRLIDHPGDDFTGRLPDGFVADLKTPALKNFEVSLEKTFDVVERFEVYSAQTAAHDYGRRQLEAHGAESVEADDYLTVYVRDPEGVITAWVVTAHIELTYSAEPGAL